MDLIRFSISKPVTVFVGVILLLLFGTVALTRLPYQLSPRVEQPVISVSTFWPGATPYEIERDVIEEQEEFLKGVQGLDEMESTSSDSFGQVTLRFHLGIKTEEALLRVSNKLEEVRRYPENVEKPVLTESGADRQAIIYTALQTTDGNPNHIDTYLTFFENNVRQYLERIPGVAEVQVRGGTEREMHVILKPERLAAFGLTIDQVIGALRGDNINISAGNLGVGRRDYRIRAVSEFRSPQDIEDVVIVSDGQRHVRVRDLAEVKFGYDKLVSVGIQDSVPGIVIPVVAEPDANTLEVTDAVEAAIAGLNAGILAENGLEITWLNDQRRYINGAINLLKQNILIGGAFACVVLLLFLRSFASTIVVATAIPISIIGSFIVMEALGTTLNIVSLAGIAFAVGMLVDNAIVVLENIDRHRKMGKTPFDSAYDGTREVWGAVLASSLTTIAVFLPVIFLEQEAGMLFRDIAIAVTAAVLISLVVSITVIPVIARLLFENRFVHKIESKVTVETRFARFGHRLRDAFMAVIGLALRNWFTRLATVGALVASALLVSRALFPPMEYLPEGNRDLIFNILIGPPGLSYEERLEIGEHIFDYMEPYYEGKDGYPPINRVFFMSGGDFMGCGVVSGDMKRTRELIPLCQQMLATIPGINGISNQSSIFGRGIGGGRAIDVNINGNRIEDMVASAGQMMGAIQQRMPGAQIRPQPTLELLYPEARFVPDGERLRAVGMDASQFGVALDVVMDGRDIGDFKQEGEKKIDLVVKVADADIRSPEELYGALIPTPGGTIVPISTLSDFVETTGLTAIRHLERNRAFTLQVTPSYEFTMEEAMAIINEEIVPEMQAQGALDDMNITMSGTADALTETRAALQWNFLLAVAITYLLMAALFANFVYPLIILFTVPLAAAGGFVGLELVNRFLGRQPLDILTMLGFIILIGIVVNNAILIVHQSLNNIRYNAMPHREAVLDATRSRLRPIYMTATTSIFGMLPLVVWPGPGSELYKGLGSVVLGGLAVSTIFTVFLIPSLLLFVIRMEKIPEPTKDDGKGNAKAKSKDPDSSSEKSHGEVVLAK